MLEHRFLQGKNTAKTYYLKNKLKNKKTDKNTKLALKFTYVMHKETSHTSLLLQLAQKPPLLREFCKFRLAESLPFGIERKGVGLGKRMAY